MTTSKKSRKAKNTALAFLDAKRAKEALPRQNARDPVPLGTMRPTGTVRQRDVVLTGADIGKLMQEFPGAFVVDEANPGQPFILNPKLMPWDKEQIERRMKAMHRDRLADLERTKRKLPLLDQSVAALDHGENAIYFDSMPKEHIKRAAKVARRFIFDKDASTYLGAFMRDCGDLIINHREFAIPPTTTCYIEFDIHAALKEMSKGGRRSTAIMLDAPMDHLVGFLIDGNRVYETARAFEGEGTKRYEGMWNLTSFDRETPANPERMFARAATREDEDWHRLTFMLGTTLDDMPSEEARQATLNSTRFHHHPPSILREAGGKWGDHFQRNAVGMNGWVRNLWACLLLINQNRGVTLTDRPAYAALVGGKRHVFQKHTTVKIELCGLKEMKRRVLNGRRETPRRHEVRGHFVHHRLSSQCTHEWGERDVDGRWPCVHCGGFRIWRKEFMRGDASKGIVIHDYAVGADR